jgi:ribose transport system permease protein
VKSLFSQKDTGSEKQQSRIMTAVIIVGALIIIPIIFNLLTDGQFLAVSNVKVIISHVVYPTFVAWGINFLFACGYTDLSIGGVIVLAAFASTAFGNLYGYPGVIIGGLVAGTLLIFINFNIFVWTKIPSWIAGISLAMIYEAIAVFLKFNPGTKGYVVADLNKSFRMLGQLPYSIIILAVGLLVCYFLYNRTTVGLNIRAIGGDRHVAKNLGIDLTKTLLLLGLISGILIGVATILQISYSGRMTVKTGLTSMYLMFQPLAIVLLAQVLQKRVNITIGIPICSLIIYIIFNFLTQLGVPSGTLQEAFLGFFIIIFGVLGVLGKGGNKGVVK